MATSLVLTAHETGETLSHDPSRWNQPLIGGHHSVADIGAARRELASTLSAIVGGKRRIDMRYNDEGAWSVVISEEVLATTIVLCWSSFTADETGHRTQITRGQALSTLIHEAMHVLYTDEIKYPDWLQDKAHVEPFHQMLNFAEDVRIEDIGESVVPAFANMRRDDNERLLLPNVAQWPTSDIVRQVCIVLFSELSCRNGGAAFSKHATTHPEMFDLIDECRPSFDGAANSGSTLAARDLLRPMYELIAPYLPTADNPTYGKPTAKVDPDEDGDPVDGVEDPDADEVPVEVKGTSGSGTTSGEGDPIDEDKEDGTGDGDDDGDEDTDDDDETGEKQAKTISDPSWREGTIRPDSARGDWDNLIEKEADDLPDTSDYYDDIIEGKPIPYYRGDEGTVALTKDEALIHNTKSRVVKTLKRVLSDNANGGWSTRKKSGVFDPRQATRLAIGDMRTFRKKRGAKGSLDYSLVLCLDASGSVGGPVGQNIARAGLSVYEAANTVYGLDVAMCAYGSGVHVGIPFDATVRDVGRDGSRNRERLSSLLDCCHRGVGASTAEDFALTWAIAASARRRAESQMIVVLTDGAPNSRYVMPKIIQGARALGIRTGGIGVMHPAPNYHEYNARVDTLEELPRVLGDLIKAMMKARR